MSASRRPAPSAPHVWMKSTLSAASVLQEEPAPAAKKVGPADSALYTVCFLLQQVLDMTFTCLVYSVVDSRHRSTVTLNSRWAALANTANVQLLSPAR